MRKIAILMLLLAIAPFEAKAFDTNGSDDTLAYVAMPLAVSAVSDVRGVQTDRVGQLVTYMDQANVAPADFHFEASTLHERVVCLRIPARLRSNHHPNGCRQQSVG